LRLQWRAGQVYRLPIWRSDSIANASSCWVCTAATPHGLALLLKRCRKRPNSSCIPPLISTDPIDAMLLGMGLCGLLQHVLHYRNLLCQLLLFLPRWLLHLYPTAVLQPLLLLLIWCCYLQPGPDAS
jgi:hypothetical protein